MKELLLSSSSITNLISSECCQKHCLKGLGYIYAMDKRNTYLSMNENMQNLYLMGCIISILEGYDYRIGNIILYVKDVKRIHSHGNL